MADKFNDITESGSQRFDQLQNANMGFQSENLFPADKYPDLQRVVVPSSNEPTQNATRQVFSPIYNARGEYLGRSRHDEDVYNDVTWNDINDVRAQNQSGLEQILNGTIKATTTAVTTFLDGTVGAMWGLGTGFANLMDDDPNTGFWRGMWDNDFNRAMASIQEKMEEIVPNYYSAKELENPWYKNIFTANFLGDKLIKNAGFTIGALATMTVGGVGIVGEGAAAAASAIGKLIVAAKGIDSFSKASKILRTSRNIGGLSQKLVNSFISANGEAAIESINAVKDNDKIMLANIDNWVRDAQEEARTNFLITGNAEQYNADLQYINEKRQEAIEETQNTMAGLGNSTYWANVTLLMLTNNLEFGKYIKGGWEPQKGIKGMRMMVDGKEVKTLREFGEGILKGKAQIEAPKFDFNFGKATLGTLGRAASEGFEEGAQRIISDSGQMQAQAKVNKWAEDNIPQDSLFAAQINPRITSDLVNRMAAIANAWKEGFGSIDGTGWEEVLLGALTGGLGTFWISKNKETGKYDFWHGGFIEEIRKPKEQTQQAAKIAEMFNKHIQNPKFVEKIRHAVASFALAEQMDNALDNNNIMAFKNAELMSVINDALFFRNFGALDAFKGFYEEMSKSVSEQDVAGVKALLSAINMQNGESWWEHKSSDEVNEALRSKAASTLVKIEQALDNYDAHELMYRDKFEKMNPELAGYAIYEITGKATLLDDLKRRKAEMEEQQRNAETTADEQRAKELIRSIKEVQDKIDEVQKEYDEWVKHPESLFRHIEDTIEKQEEALARTNAVKAEEKLKTVKTIQELANFYFSMDPEFRRKVFDKVTRDAEGQLKDLLMNFRPFVATLDSLSNLIADKASEYVRPFNEELAQYEDDVDTRELEQERNEIYENYLRVLRSEVMNIIDDILNDETAGYDKNAIQNAIERRAQQIMNNPREMGYTDARSAFTVANELLNIADDVQSLSEVYNEFVETEEPVGESVEEETNPEETTEDDETTGGEESGRSTVRVDNDGLIEGGIYDDALDAPELEDILAEDGEENGSEEESAENLEEESSESEESEDDESGFVQDDEESSENEQPESEETTDEDGEETGSEDEGKMPKLLTTGIAGLLPAHRESEHEDSKTSFRAFNNFEEFLLTKLRDNGIAQKSKYQTFANWINRKRLNLYDMQNRYVKRLMELHEDGKLPVHYMVTTDGVRGNITNKLAEGKENLHIFLVTPMTEEIREIITEENSTVTGNVIKSNDKEYVVVGMLGFSSSDKGLAKQHHQIAVMMQEHAANSEQEEFYVYDKGDGIQNYIYDITPGYVIRKMGEEQGQPADTDLGMLLDNPDTNPMNLEARDLKWMVYMGKEDVVGDRNVKLYNVNPEDNVRMPADRMYPGKAYVLLKASDGSYIPQAISPIRFADLAGIVENMNEKGAVWEELMKIIDGFSKAKSVEERKSLIIQLRDRLVFTSPRGANNTNIFYDEKGDTLSYSVGDLAQRGTSNIIDFNNTSPEEIAEKLFKMLIKTNPRITINTSTLLKNPSHYLDSHVLQVNLRSLGTYNAHTYAYPINADGTPNVGFRVVETTSVEKPTTTEQQIFLNKEMFRIQVTRNENGTDSSVRVLDKDGNIITDATTLKELSHLLNIQNGVIKPTKLHAVGNSQGKVYEYYVAQESDKDADTFIYVKYAQAGYKRIAGADLATYRSRAIAERKRIEAQEALERAEQEAREAQEENPETPVEPAPEDNSQDNKPVKPKKPRKPRESTKKKTDKKPANGEKSGRKDSGDSNDSTGSAIFASWYNNMFNMERIESLFENMGEEMPETFDDLLAKLMNGKHGMMFMQITDESSLNDYLDKIEECGI